MGLTDITDLKKQNKFRCLNLSHCNFCNCTLCQSVIDYAWDSHTFVSGSAWPGYCSVQQLKRQNVAAKFPRSGPKPLEMPESLTLNPKITVRPPENLFLLQWYASLKNVQKSVSKKFDGQRKVKWPILLLIRRMLCLTLTLSHLSYLLDCHSSSLWPRHWRRPINYRYTHTHTHTHYRRTSQVSALRMRQCRAWCKSRLHCASVYRGDSFIPDMIFYLWGDISLARTVVASAWWCSWKDLVAILLKLC